MSSTPAERSMQRRLAVHSSWAKTEDRAGRTEPARKASFARFEKLVDPAGVLTPEERAKRANNALQAHMLRMALAAAKAKRLRKQAGEIEAGLAAEDPELVAGETELADGDGEAP